MSKKLKSYYKSLERVKYMIELLINCHPLGFKILLGEADAPTSNEIHEMMNSQRVPMPDDFRPTSRSNETEANRIVDDSERFDECVKMAGGWDHIHEVSRTFKKMDRRFWAIVIAHVNFVARPSSRYGSKLERVAEHYRVAPRTVTKYRKEFSDKLAMMILMPTEDEFYLIPS